MIFLFKLMVLGVHGIPLESVILPLGQKQETGSVTIQHKKMEDRTAQGLLLRLRLVQVRIVTNQHL